MKRGVGAGESKEELELKCEGGKVASLAREVIVVGVVGLLVEQEFVFR